MEAIHQVVLALLSLGGVGAAYVLYRAAPGGYPSVAAMGTAGTVFRLWFHGWRFDDLYDRFIVRPFLAMAQANRADAVDAVYTSLARFISAAHASLSTTQTGSVRWYATVVAGSAVLFIWYMIT